jgi:hypothetical protein
MHFRAMRLHRLRDINSALAELIGDVLPINGGVVWVCRAERVRDLAAVWGFLDPQQQSSARHSRDFQPDYPRTRIGADRVHECATCGPKTAKSCGTFAGLSCALPCSTLATAVRPTGFRSIRRQQNQTVTIRPCLRDLRLVQPGSPYKANVGGSIPSAGSHTLPTPGPRRFAGLPSLRFRPRAASFHRPLLF